MDYKGKSMPPCTSSPTCYLLPVQQEKLATSFFLSCHFDPLIKRSGTINTIMVNILLQIMYIVSANSSGTTQMNAYYVRQPVTLSSISVNINASLGTTICKSELRCGLACFQRGILCVGFYYDELNGNCTLLRSLNLPSDESPSLVQRVFGVRTYENVAFGRPALMSSQFNADGATCCRAAYAVDADSTTIAHTMLLPRQWILIDLGYDYIISGITVVARCNNAGWRAHDYDLRVGHSSAPNTSGFFDGQLCAHRDGAMANCQSQTIYCSCPLVGRYVSMQVMLTYAQTGNAAIVDNALNVADIYVNGTMYAII